MVRGLAVTGAIGAFAAGCASTADRPARFNIGPNMRTLVAPVAGSSAVSGAVAREGSSTTPDDATARYSAVTMSAQFTMRSPYNTYLGGEVEAGRMTDQSGSNVGGAYAIAGGELVGRFGSLGAELAGGWRGLRYNLGDEDHDALVLEPRVRAQFWIHEQFTLGGAVGATIGAGGEWVAGIYLGVHSHLFDVRPY